MELRKNPLSIRGCKYKYNNFMCIMFCDINSMNNFIFRLTNLKGHSDRVLDISLSSNEKFLASSCLDRSLLLWPTKQFNSKDHKCIRGNVSYDHGAHIKWSPDSKAIIVHKEISRQIEVYKVSKKEGTDSYTI